MYKALTGLAIVAASAHLLPAHAQSMMLPFGHTSAVLQQDAGQPVQDDGELLRKWHALAPVRQAQIRLRLAGLSTGERRRLLAQALGLPVGNPAQLDALAAHVAQQATPDLPLKVTLERIDSRAPRVDVTSTTALAIRAEWVSGVSGGPDFRALQFYEVADGLLRNLPLTRCAPVPRSGAPHTPVSHRCFQSLPILKDNPTVYVDLPFHTPDGALVVRSAPLTIPTVK